VEIKIPNRFSDNFGEPLNYIIKQLIIINQENPTKLIFDFSGSKFISPFVIGSVIALTNHLRRKGKTVSFKVDGNSNVTNYFETIRFPDGYNFDGLSSAEMNFKLEEYGLKTFIPLVLFPTGANQAESTLRENVLSAINSILKKQLKLDGGILEAVYYLIDELTNNIADHSSSEKGILFAQFYPTKNYMDICIIDYGKGIRQTYLDSGKANPSSDEEAIEFAIKGKSTKDQSISRGFGISTSRTMITDGLKGKFFIYSGNALFYQNSEKQEIISLPQEANYQGCMVAIRVPILPNSQFDFYKYTQ
jgi:anti-sigma regulatory factor (Ser/Thr protein kinase)